MRKNNQFTISLAQAYLLIFEGGHQWFTAKGNPTLADRLLENNINNLHVQERLSRPPFLPFAMPPFRSCHASVTGQTLGFYIN